MQRAGRPPLRRDFLLPSTPTAAPPRPAGGPRTRRESQAGPRHGRRRLRTPPSAPGRAAPRPARAAPRHWRARATRSDALQELGPTKRRLDEIEAGGRASDRQGDARHSSATSDVGHQGRHSLAQRLVEHRQGGKAVGEMNVDSLVWIPDRRGRVRVLRQSGKEPPAAAPPARLLQPMCGHDRREAAPAGGSRARFHVLRPSGQVDRSGVITMRRKGSSPSLCVSTSGRSFRYVCTTRRSCAPIESSSTGRP